MGINWKSNKFINNLKKDNFITGWKNNKLGKKIFVLGLGAYIIFSIIVYFVIYYGIPVIYSSYKKSSFENSVKMVTDNSKTMGELQENIMSLRENTNISVFYEYQGNRYECFISVEECTLARNKPNNGGYKYDSRDDFLAQAKTIENFEGSPLTIFFSTSVSSTKEVQNILFMFLPIFGILSAVMASISAYIISNRLSKNIVGLRNDARRITSLDFNISQSVTTADELGDLSNSLVVMASTLNETLNDLQDANAKLYDDIEKERLKEEERRAYIATISHDLKTPLTAIKGQLEGMLYDIGKYKDHKTFLKKNIELTDEMESMIQSIILSSKLDDYNASVNKEEYNLYNIIECIVDELEYTIESKKVTIVNNLDSETIVHVDKNLFTRVLSNLIGNAIQYANSDTSIIITMEEGKLKISNEIDDFDRKLIDEELIFKPFYRQDKSRNKNGSGLGMYIVKKICDLHGIDINLSYEDNIYTAELDLNE